MQIRRTALLFLFPCLLGAQDRAPVEPMSLPAPDQPVEAVKPVIEKIDEHRYRIGDITIDPRSREISFPARVNMSDGLLEFLIVHHNGKIHESLFHTAISATHLNIAFKLLRYPASRELYFKPSETGGLSGELEEATEEEKAGARIRIDVEWEDAGKTRRVAVNEWIQHATTGAAMPSKPWIYGGSEVYGGKFVPETTGDIAAIFITNSALINYAGEDNQDDTVWLAFPKRVPEIETKVTLYIAPFEKNQPNAKP
jgi:hypothetical protein